LGVPTLNPEAAKEFNHTFSIAGAAGTRENTMMNLGLFELVIILAILFFIFGGRKIPQISKGFGLAIRNFKKGLHEPDAIDVTPQKENPPEKTLKFCHKK
jgi:sec-independent protein translocase protein TatA